MCGLEQEGVMDDRDESVARAVWFVCMMLASIGIAMAAFFVALAIVATVFG